MIVRVLFFASAKDVAGTANMQIAMADDANLGQLKQTLVEQIPGLMNIMSHASCSVDQEYANDDRQLYHGAEVAVIPPVSGG